MMHYKPGNHWDKLEWRSGSVRPLSSTLHQIPQHLVQDSAVAVVLDLDWRVDAASGDEVDLVAVGLAGL